MKRASKIACVCLAVCIGVLPIAGCQGKGVAADPDLSNARYVAELATLKCYYHNVARLDRKADGFLFLPTSNGYKKVWIEYDATADVGIDVSKVQISEPSQTGVVSITIPQAKLLGRPNVDENSITDPPYEDMGFMTSFTKEDKKQVLEEAQDALVEEINKDETLMSRARQRVKMLLEQYVKNLGEQFDKSYTVEWVDAVE